GDWAGPAGSCPRAHAPRALRVGRGDRRRGPSWSPSVVGGVSLRPLDLYNTVAQRIHARARRKAHRIRGGDAHVRTRGGPMAISEYAGRPADPSMLVDVDRLVGSYFEIRPDPADPAQRVAFGTSGHRGSSLNGAFNEAHIAATTEAICRYRKSQGIDGPLFVGKD